MELTPREKDKLLLYTAAMVARDRRARGVKLNYPEAIALISAEIVEGARDGRSVAELMSYGTTLLTRNEVMDGIAEMIHDLPGRHEVSDLAQPDTVKAGQYDTR